MRMMYDNGSAEMMKILKKAQECGAATSLDMAAVDPDAPVGHVDWDKYLTEVIPYVDFFVPSIEELCYMIDRDRFQEWKERADGRDVCMILDPEKDIKPLADECMKRGAKVLFLKCGAPGAYLCTANEDVLKKIPSALGFDAKIWANQTIFEKSYKPEKVLSGTGAGDTSIAAFLSSILKGYSPQTAMQMAAGTGASCVEDYGALGGLRTFDELKTKIANGWEKNNFF